MERTCLVLEVEKERLGRVPRGQASQSKPNCSQRGFLLFGMQFAQAKTGSDRECLDKFAFVAGGK
jgi:hypothetical protein